MKRARDEIAGSGWLRSLVVAFVVQVSLNVAVLLAIGIGVASAFIKAEAAEKRVYELEIELKGWVLIDARKEVEKMIEAEIQRREDANTIEPRGDHVGPAGRPRRKQ